MYAANAENTFESIRTRVEVNLRANPAISLSGSARLCGNQPLTLTAATADEYLWSNGATTRSITVSQPGAYSVKVKDRTLGCENTSQVVAVTLAPATVAKFRSDMTEIAWKDNTAFSFFDESTNAVAWLWNFGDGTTSAERNPKHTFSTFGSYNVTLTVTSPEGCTSTATALKVSITGLEGEMFSRLVSLYPNPNRGSFRLVMNTERYGTLNVVIYNALGKEVQRMNYKKTAETFEAVVEAPGLPGGLYFVHIDDGTAKAVKRMVVE